MEFEEVASRSDLHFFPTIVVARQKRESSSDERRSPDPGVSDALHRLATARRLAGTWCESVYIRKDAASALKQSRGYLTLRDCFRSEMGCDDCGDKRCSGYLDAHAYLRRKLSRPRSVLCAPDLLNAHRRLFAGMQLKPGIAGCLRTSDVRAIALPRGRHSLPAELVPNALEKLLLWLRRSLDLPAVTRVAIAHAEFMLIQPFEVGNMRLAQLLTTVLLERWAGVLPILSLNCMFRRRIEDYHKRLGAVASRNHWRNWLEFIDSCVTDAAKTSAQAICDVMAICAERRNGLLQNAKTGMPAMRLEALLRRHPVVTPKFAARLLKASVPTAATALNSLVDVGILEEISGRRRDQEFADNSFLKILSADLDELINADQSLASNQADL